MEGQHKESFPEQLLSILGKKYTHTHDATQERHGVISLGLGSASFGRTRTIC